MFGIHINTQNVVTFLDIGTCTTSLCMYPLRIIQTCDETRPSVEFVTVGFLGICRQYCSD